MSSEPSKTIPPPAPAWSPDQKLRADATEQDFKDRAEWLKETNPMKPSDEEIQNVLRDAVADLTKVGGPSLRRQQVKRRS